MNQMISVHISPSEINLFIPDAGSCLTWWMKLLPGSRTSEPRASLTFLILGCSISPNSHELIALFSRDKCRTVVFVVDIVAVAVLVLVGRAPTDPVDFTTPLKAIRNGTFPRNRLRQKYEVLQDFFLDRMTIYPGISVVASVECTERARSMVRLEHQRRRLVGW